MMGSRKPQIMTGAKQIALEPAPTTGLRRRVVEKAGGSRPPGAADRNPSNKANVPAGPAKAQNVK